MKRRGLSIAPRQAVVIPKQLLGAAALMLVIIAAGCGESESEKKAAAQEARCRKALAVFATDGQEQSGWIAFTRGRTNHGDIWLIRPRDGKLRRLTHDAADDWLPSWSPDGKQLAWIRTVKGRPRLVVAPVGVSGPIAQRYLVPVSRLPADSVSWAPSGNQIAFGSAWNPGAQESLDELQQRIAVVDLRNHRTKIIVANAGTNYPSPVWSPDGKLIAFTADSGIVVVRPDGSGGREIDLGGTGPSWSPDGRWLAFDNGQLSQLLLVHRDGSGLRSIDYQAKAISGVTWSPDGETLVYTIGDWDVFGEQYYALRSTRVRDLLTCDLAYPNSDFTDPAWSSFGSSIAFTDLDVFGSGKNTDLFVLRGDGTGVKQLTKTGDVHVGVAWQPRPRPTTS